MQDTFKSRLNHVPMYTNKIVQRAVALFVILKSSLMIYKCFSVKIWSNLYKYERWINSYENDGNPLVDIRCTDDPIAWWKIPCILKRYYENLQRVEFNWYKISFGLINPGLLELSHFKRSVFQLLKTFQSPSKSWAKFHSLLLNFNWLVDENLTVSEERGLTLSWQRFLARWRLIKVNVLPTRAQKWP